MNHAGFKGEDRQELRIIGLGSCGTVFEIAGSDHACKKGADTTAMWQDFCLTNKVYNAILKTYVLLRDSFDPDTIPRTPKCHEFVLPDQKPWWEENMKWFPTSHKQEGALFTVDRILPLPQSIREQLIMKYFDEDQEIQDEAKNDEENQHCLVRIYLGQNENLGQQKSTYDSLRNFPMHLNMLKEVDMDVSELATGMAIGLAILHWEAQVDAMDTEFVLGSAPSTEPTQAQAYVGEGLPRPVQLNFARRSIHLWMLDFDKASRIKLITSDVDKKLVPAFLGNDPYYPRPDVDEDLWDDFCSVYLKTSTLILQNNKADEWVLTLPKRFLEKVVELIKEHEGWNPDDNILFEED